MQLASSVSARRAAQAALAILDRATAVAALLVLPLVLLLFVQWPLRDLWGAWSRPANDLAQCVFALYVAFALRHASRRHAHMAADAWAARHHSPRLRRALRRLGPAACVLPWSLYVLVAGWPMVASAVTALEAFPDTFNPGYFTIKASAWLLALLMALQSVVELALSDPDAPR